MQEPVRKSTAPRSGREADEHRSHAVRAPGLVGAIGDERFFAEMEGTADADMKRPVLIEEDVKHRQIAHAYLSGAPIRGLVDYDVVLVATQDATVVCYDCGRHEIRWEKSFADRGWDIDELVRRGDKIDVVFAGKTTETISVLTGDRSLP
jgi:hypothetical protein